MESKGLLRPSVTERSSRRSSEPFSGALTDGTDGTDGQNSLPPSSSIPVDPAKSAEKQNWGDRVKPVYSNRKTQQMATSGWLQFFGEILQKEVTFCEKVFRCHYFPKKVLFSESCKSGLVLISLVGKIRSSRLSKSAFPLSRAFNDSALNIPPSRKETLHIEWPKREGKNTPLLLLSKKDFFSVTSFHDVSVSLQQTRLEKPPGFSGCRDRNS